MDRKFDESERMRRVEIIVDQCGGISPAFEAFYIQSIIYASTASTEAFQRFSDAVVNEGGSALIVSSVQEALTHAAALSRFFWPAGKSKIATARAAKLRAAFNMTSSPLENRDLRNALEHFDERLDDFLFNDPVGYFFPGPLVQCHEIADEEPGQIFRLVDPYEFIFVILRKRYEFYDIFSEVARVKQMAQNFDRNGSNLKPSR